MKKNLQLVQRLHIEKEIKVRHLTNKLKNNYLNKWGTLIVTIKVPQRNHSCHYLSLKNTTKTVVTSFI